MDLPDDQESLTQRDRTTTTSFAAASCRKMLHSYRISARR